jgi:hypothetical protein
MPLNYMYSNFSKFLDGKPAEKRTHGRPRHRWESNIRMDFREAGVRVWIEFIWHKVQSSGGIL